MLLTFYFVSHQYNKYEDGKILEYGLYKNLYIYKHLKFVYKSSDYLTKPFEAFFCS